MTKEEVIALLESSKNSASWDDNCDKIKKAFGGNYPEFWFQDVMQSGLMRRVLERCGSDPDFHISVGDRKKVFRNDAAR